MQTQAVPTRQAKKTDTPRPALQLALSVVRGRLAVAVVRRARCHFSYVYPFWELHMKIYENVVIGNFLFALGYALRDKGRVERLGAVNLLQQTPADRFLGDLLLDFPGVVAAHRVQSTGG